MKLRKWWSALPWDAHLGYITAGFFIARFSAAVFVGPSGLLLMLFGCLVYVLVAVIAFLLVSLFVVSPPRRPKLLPLVLVLGCVVFPFTAPHAEVDLHLIVRVYRAGGPNALNEWAQGLIREYEARNEEEQHRSHWVEEEQIPPGVRAHLRGDVYASRHGVRFELGGGFFHYGVFVVPKGRAQPVLWQRVIGWPPEVVVYHED